MTTPVSARQDIRLIAVDMDGTLLDESGQVPPGTWELLDQLRERGVVFAAASGRQYASLARTFGSHGESMAFISENGSYVVKDGAEISSLLVDRDVVHEIVRLSRRLDQIHPQVSAVLGGKQSGYLEKRSPVEQSAGSFLTEVAQFYADRTLVDDLLEVTDDILKIAVYHSGDAETVIFPRYAHLHGSVKVVVGASRWLDIMHPDANKGSAVRQIQANLGISPAQTMVFGDYLNDIEMMDAADWSYAMENAHPDVKARARFTAPSNAEHGVLKVITEVLGLK